MRRDTRFRGREVEQCILSFARGDMFRREDMRRLAIIDGLISVAAVLFVGLLVMTVAGVQPTEAYARPWWISCQTPVVCPGSSGTCGGCVAGPQVGVCS